MKTLEEMKESLVVTIKSHIEQRTGGNVDLEEIKQTVDAVLEHFNYAGWAISLNFGNTSLKEYQKGNIVSEIYDADNIAQASLIVSPDGTVTIAALNTKRANNGGMTDAMYTIYIKGNEISGDLHDIIDLSTEDSYDSISVQTSFGKEGIMLDEKVVPYVAKTSAEKLREVEQIHLATLAGANKALNNTNVITSERTR